MRAVVPAALALMAVMVLGSVPLSVAQVNPYVLPTITLTPNSGDLSTQVTIAGTGFSPNIQVTVSIVGVVAVSTFTTDASGGFTGPLAISEGAAGSYTVTANGSDLATNPKDKASATFTLLNVATATVTTATVTSNTVKVNNSKSTGTTVSISGLTGVTGGVTVATAKETAAPNIASSAPLPTGTVYLDIKVTLPSGVTAPAGATVLVCQTDPTVTSSSTLQYFSNGAWVVATGATVTGTTICANIPLSALTGTPIAIVPGAPVDYTIYYIGGFVLVLLVVVGAALFLRRRGGRSL